MGGRFLLSGALLLAVGCVGSRGPSGPVISPTGIVYEPGVAPAETRWSQTASLYLRSENPERALEFSTEGAEVDPDNPIHHFLAGVALARLGRYQEADRAFQRAETIYPAYELDVEPEREAAWAEAFNVGSEAWADGDVEGALEAWQGATIIFELRPEAHGNLAMLLQEERRYDEAIDVYRRALVGLERRPATRLLREDEILAREDVRARTEASLADLLLVTDRFAEAEPLLRRQLEADPDNTRIQQNLALALGALGRSDEAADLHESLLAEGTLQANELFSLGVALFRASDYPRAAEAFGRLVELRPDSRDAWFNYVNALFAAEAWGALARAGDRLVTLDPLNENVALIAARAHLEAGDEARAIRGVQRIEAAPVHVEGLALRPAPGGALLQGRATGNAAEPGTPVRLRFTFLGESGMLGNETITVEAPAPGEMAPFEVSFRMPAVGYRYEVVEVGESGGPGGGTSEGV